MPSCYYYDEQSNRCSCYGNDSLNELLDENAKLRESVRRLMTQRDDRLARAETDNAKLRELVRDVWNLFTEHGAVNPCDLPVVDAVRDHMRELGIEAG